MIFIDADAYIGNAIPTDPHNKKSILLFEMLANAGTKLATSWDVLDEVATKLSRFSTKNTANIFLSNLTKSDTLIEHVDDALVSKIVVLFRKQTSKRVSLTDCTNMVIAKSLGIDTIFSFDNHYRKNGFRLLTAKYFNNHA